MPAAQQAVAADCDTVSGATQVRHFIMRARRARHVVKRLQRTVRMLGLVVSVLIALVFSEAALLLLEQKRYALQAVLAALTVGVMLALWFWFETPWTLFPERKIAVSLLGFWTVAVPIVVLSALSFGASKLTSPVFKHLVILLIGPIVVYAYPLFALLSVCASGLACI